MNSTPQQPEPSATPRTDWAFKCAGRVNTEFLALTRDLERALTAAETELRATRAELASERAAGAWRPIETAPKDGTEILGFRHDCGTVLIRWIAPINFLTDDELKECTESALEPDWFFADFITGGRMSNDGMPTHWMPLPLPPQALAAPTQAGKVGP